MTALDNIGGWPARWAVRRGDELAVADDHHRLDWTAFESRVARVAGWLTAQGVTSGDRVALLLGNRSALLEVVFGAARIGAISLPVNLRLSPREVAYQLDDCRPDVLFHEVELQTAVDNALALASHRPRICVGVGHEGSAYEHAIDRAAAIHDCRPVSADHPAILMYTSGTTGSPKGALLPHRKALFNSLNAGLDFGIRSDDRVLVVAPLFHSLGLQILALPLLYAGGSLILRDRFDPHDVWKTVSRERITYFGGVPSMHQRLHDALAAGPTVDEDVESLRFVFTAGSAISSDLVHRFEQRGILLMQGYGQTESSTLCCLRPEDAVRKAGSVGRPVFHAEVRIVTLESRDREVAHWCDTTVGETGEIVVRGPITMLGYWNDPIATAEALREGWLLTGDLARCDGEGFITLVGRSRDMIISGGENVYPAEVEAVYREHPDIREIAVLGVPDERFGEAGRAHLLLEPGVRFDRTALDAWARERLAVFKIPKHYVIEQELPRTASGKVRKHALRDPEV